MMFGESMLRQQTSSAEPGQVFDDPERRVSSFGMMTSGQFADLIK